MNINEFVSKQRNVEGISAINNLLEKIKSNSIDKSPLYLEWLTWRALLCIGGYKSEPRAITNTILNEDFTPKRCAPPKVPDLQVIYPNLNVIVEVTERPIPGKVEHFSHFSVFKDVNKNTSCGILITKCKLDEVPLETWNTYKNSFDIGKGLFMLLSIDFLVSLINKYKDKSSEKWILFLEEYKKIWINSSSWEDIREKALKL